MNERSEEQYLNLWECAKKQDHNNLLSELKQLYGWTFDKDDLDNIGLQLQICIKGSAPLYVHGYILSSALHHYIKNSTDEKLTIFESGTARGFSSIIMAKTLEMNNKDYDILTMDILPHFSKIDWNCIGAPYGGLQSRFNLLQPWKDIRDKIKFLEGNSNDILKDLNLDRIHFAFLDGDHVYHSLMNELNYTEKRQVKGDIIVCDDYTKTQFPEIVKAIDDFLDRKKYQGKFFYASNSKDKVRGYVVMTKI